MKQDFDNKISICIRKDLPEWQSLNTAAHIAAYFGNQLGDQFRTGDSFITADRVSLPRNSQHGIAILRADTKDLRRVIRKANEADITWMGFFQEMLDLLDDNALQEIVATKRADEMDYLGIGLYGNRQILEGITKGVQAWK